MVDPSLSGPASEQALGVFQALNRLNVITVRPLMLSIVEADEADEGLRRLLRLVVRRIVVGNLGTGNIERRFSEAARRVREAKNWHSALSELDDLNPDRDYFIEQIGKRSFNKGVMSFIRNSVIQSNITPNLYYNLHYIIPKSIKDGHNISDGDLSYWGNTIGNTFLSTEERRAADSDTWGGFRANMFPIAAPEEMVARLSSFEEWTVDAIQEMARVLSARAAEIWYD